METIFRKLPKDILLKLAMELDLSEILNLCESDKKINDNICENNWFWKEKLQKDFYVNYNNIETKENPKTLYFDLDENFNKCYTDVLRNHLIKYGNMKNFKNEICKLLGPYYKVNINIYVNVDEKYDKLHTFGVNEILLLYFKDPECRYYPFLDAFKIIYYEDID